MNKKELLNILREVAEESNTRECGECNGTGINPHDPLSACDICGGYGFNPSGDIREAILSARAAIAKAEGKQP